MRKNTGIILLVLVSSLMTENELSGIVIHEAIEVHKALGPGMLEKVYVECLHHQLVKRGLNVVKEQSLPVVYKEIEMDCAYKADLVVENKLIIEVKSIEAIADIHIAQALTYLKISNCKLCLVINFNVNLLKNGIKRVVNNL